MDERIKEDQMEDTLYSVFEEFKKELMLEMDEKEADGLIRRLIYLFVSR